MKKNSRKIALICSVIAIVCIASGVIYYVLNRPKMIFVNTLQKMSNMVFDVLTVDDTKDMDDRYQLNLTGTITPDPSQGIEPFGVNLQYQVDKTLKETLGTFALLNNGTEHIGLDFYLQENKIYYKVKQLMDRYYFSSIETTTDATTLSFDDGKYMINIFLKQLNHNLTTANVQEKTSTLSIAQEEIEAKRISVTFTDQLMSSIIKDTIEAISKDDHAMAIAMKWLGVTNEKDAKEKFNTILDDENDKSEPEDLFTYHIYVKNNIVIAHMLEQDQDKMLLAKYNDVTLFSYSENDSDLMHLEIKKNTNDTYQIDGSFGGIYHLSGTCNQTDTKTTIDIDLQSLGKLTVVMDKKDTPKTTIELSIDGVLTSSWSVEYKNIDALDEVDLSNSIDYNSVSEEELSNLGEQLLLKILQFPPLQSMATSVNQISPSI